MDMTALKLKIVEFLLRLVLPSLVFGPLLILIFIAIKLRKKIYLFVKLFLLLSLVFSSLFLFNYAYFKGNDGMFLLNALDSAEVKPSPIMISPFSFNIDSIDWLLFAPRTWRYHFGLLICAYYYKIPYTDPIYFCSPGYDKVRDTGDVYFFYLNFNEIDPVCTVFSKSSSKTAFQFPLTPDDYKIIDSFLNTKRIPYLKSISLELKNMPVFLHSEIYNCKFDGTILLELPVLALTVIFSIPYLYLQIIIPPSLSIYFFWLWITFSVFYIVTPYRILKRIGEKVRGFLHMHSKGET